MNILILGFGLGAIILGLAIAWGMSRSSRRDRRNDPITDAATRELYKDPSRYDEKTRVDLQGKLK